MVARALYGINVLCVNVFVDSTKQRVEVECGNAMQCLERLTLLSLCVLA